MADPGERVERSHAESSRRLYLVLAAMTVAGLLLGGAMRIGGSFLLGAIVGAVSALLGAFGGLLAFLVVADLFLSRGEDDDVLGRMAGGRLMTGLVALGAVVNFAYIFILRR